MLGGWTLETDPRENPKEIRKLHGDLDTNNNAKAVKPAKRLQKFTYMVTHR